MFSNAERRWYNKNCQERTQVRTMSKNKKSRQKRGSIMKIAIDTHSHTIASGHAYCTIREMASAAAKKGLQGLAITEHAPTMPGTCHPFYFSNLKVIPRQMSGVEMLFGVELNILDADGTIDLSEALLKEMDLVRQNARENQHTILELCKKYKVPVTLASDAHVDSDVGNVRYSLEVVRECGFPEELVVNTSIEKLKKYIGRCPKGQELSDEKISGLYKFTVIKQRTDKSLTKERKE